MLRHSESLCSSPALWMLLLSAVTSRHIEASPQQSATRASVSVRAPVIPVCHRGHPARVLELVFKLDRPHVLRRLTFDHRGTTDVNDLGQLSARTESEEFASVLIRGPESVLEGELTLGTGRSVIQVSLQVARPCDLSHRVGIACRSVEFDSGSLDLEPPTCEPLRLANFVHRQGDDDCHTFRIPAIARTSANTLLAVYDMRYESRRDLQGHMDIGLSRSTDGGQTFAAPVPILDMGTYGGRPQNENGCSDPGILVDPSTGEIFVAAVWTHGKPGTHQWTGRGSEPGMEIGVTTQFVVTRSRDDGLSWSEPENWTPALKRESWWLFAPAPGNGIALADGTLVLPTQGRDDAGLPFSCITWSRDHGQSWTVSPPARSNTTECAVVECSDGSLLLNMRDNRNRKDKGDSNGRAVSRTTDLGARWQIHSSDHSALPEPVCMASLIHCDLKDGRRVLLFSNPHDRHQRRNMTLQISFDEGASWPAQHHVLLDQLGGAYSSLVMVDAETIGILYESSQADFVFQRVSLADLVR